MTSACTIADASIAPYRSGVSLAMEKVAEGDLVQVKIMRISIGLFGQVQRQYRVVLKAVSRKPKIEKFSMSGSLNPNAVLGM